MQTIDGSMKSGVEKMNWIIFFSPAKAELFIVVLLLPRNQSHFWPAFVSSHVDHGRIRWVQKQIQAAPGFEPEASARQSASLSTALPLGPNQPLKALKHQSITVPRSASLSGRWKNQIKFWIYANKLFLFLTKKNATYCDDVHKFMFAMKKTGIIFGSL